MGKSSGGKGDLDRGLVKDFRVLMGQMVSCIKGFEQMSKNYLIV